MARSLWKGAISFGLVNIPVELFPAEERKGFQFSMLDKRDFSPVGYKRYSKKSGKEVEWGNIVKGYEYEKDQYVVLSDEDFRRANVKASRTIDIKAFVPATEIPPQYYETPYYLAPTDRGEKVYALLRETLRATGRVAVAQVVIRTTRAPGRRRASGTRADAGHDALCRRDPRRQRLRAAGRRIEERRVTHQGSRSRQAPGRRHDRALEARGIQGHVSRGSDASDPRKDQETAKPRRSPSGRRRTARSRARPRSSISLPC